MLLRAVTTHHARSERSTPLHNLTPVPGQTYATTVMDNVAYQELTLSSFTTKTWLCTGNVTYDTVVAPSYTFHFAVSCTTNGSAWAASR